jgi:hypothetical protein
LFANAGATVAGNESVPEQSGSRDLFDGKFIAASRAGPACISTDWGAEVESLSPQGARKLVPALRRDYVAAAAYDDGAIYTAQSSPAPILNIAPSNTGVLLSWIVPSMPLMLQQNPDLISTNWTAVLVEPTLNYGRLENEVCVPAPTGRNFYRLISK